MERNRPDFSNWKRPPAEGALALQQDISFSPRPRLQVVPAIIDARPSKSFGDKLTIGRNNFAERQEKNKVVKAYEVEQDVVLYNVLAKEKGKSGYEEAKRDLDAYMDIQLNTHLGERLHVGVSQLHHNIVDGELRVADTDESLLEMLDRGREYRRKHGKPIDWDREEAEVLGFERIQKKLADPNTPVGTMMFFVSPPGDVEKGSIYKNNFYDVHRKISEKKVISSRYTSGLTPEESHQRLRLVDRRYDRDELPTDAEMIANPVEVEPGTKGLETPDDVHDYMHVDHKHMSKEKFVVVMQACQPLKDDYKKFLRKDPDNIAEHKKRLDILMNYADNVAKELKPVSEGQVVALSLDQKDARPWIPPQIDREALGRQEVRVAATGCGSSGGSGDSIFSVAEAGDSRYTGENAKDDPNLCHCGGNEAHFHCPGNGGTCLHEIIVGKGTSSCPECGAGKVC